MEEPSDPIEFLRHKLGQQSWLLLTSGEEGPFRSLRMEPLDREGFPIELEDDIDEWTVHYGEAGSHFHFETGEEALEFIGLLLSGDCRLLEVWRGDRWQSGKIQVPDERGWRTTHSSGVLLRPFWRRKRFVVRQNRPPPPLARSPGDLPPHN